MLGPGSELSIRGGCHWREAGTCEGAGCPGAGWWVFGCLLICCVLGWDLVSQFAAQELL